MRTLRVSKVKLACKKRFDVRFRKYVVNFNTFCHDDAVPTTIGKEAFNE